MATVCAVDGGAGPVSLLRMIHGPLITVNPFGDPQLCWCEAGFSVEDVQGLTHDGVRIALPDDLASAVPKRRSEFLAGRLCAAAALRTANLPQEVARNGRAPVWPAGVVGSISHSKTRAMACVSTYYQALGIDCEDMVDSARAAKLQQAIFTSDEAALRPADMEIGVFFTLIFSAKEALYKALSPRLNRVPEFLDVTLTALSPGHLTLVLDGQPHGLRFVIRDQDCLTLLAE
jgi:enterobactin synthetase component D